VNNWYYESNGGQAGPVTKEEILAMVGRGELGPASLVWTDGMPGWQSVAQVPALSVVPAVSPVAPSPYSAPAMTPAAGVPVAAASNPYAPPSVAYQPAPLPQAGGFPAVKRANYGLSLGLFLGGLVSLIIGVATTSAGRDTEAIGIPFAIVGVGLLLTGGIQFLIYLYRAWLVLQPHTTRSTPGKAVGFLFIPFFSIYWKFVAYWRWAEEWNRLVANVRPGAPRASEGLFLAYAITGAAALVAGALAALPALVLFLIIMRQVCAAVNYAADYPA